MENLFKVRELAVFSNKFNKLSQKIFTSSDQILTGHRKKLNNDSKIVGSCKYDIEEDISELTKEIIRNEDEIAKSMQFLKQKQEDLCDFLINYNKTLVEREQSNTTYI